MACNCLHLMLGQVTGKRTRLWKAMQQYTGAILSSPRRPSRSPMWVPGLGQALPAVHRYCARLQQPSFWGGEVEILVLSRMLKVPIYVYKSAQEAGR